MAQRYHRRAEQGMVLLDRRVQRALVDEAIRSCAIIGIKLHAAGCEVSHVHLLVSWRFTRSWLSVRTSFKTSLTKKLLLLNRSRDATRRAPLRFSTGASRKRVQSREHFDYLIDVYLPKHKGVCWDDKRGWIR